MRTLFDVEQERKFTAAYTVFAFLTAVTMYISPDFFKATLIFAVFMYGMTVFAYIKLRSCIDNANIPFMLLMLLTSLVLFYMSESMRRVHLGGAIAAFIIFLASAIRYTVRKIRGKDVIKNSAWQSFVIVFAAFTLVLVSAPIWDGILSVAHKNTDARKLEGKDYYTSGAYEFLRHGNEAKKFLPEYSELSDALSIDFAYTDYSAKDSLFFNSNTQFLLRATFDDEKFARLLTNASSVDSFPERLGKTGYLGYYMERRDASMNNNAYFFMCFNAEKQSVIYVVLIDNKLKTECIEHLSDSKTGFLLNSIWEK